MIRRAGQPRVAQSGCRDVGGRAVILHHRPIAGNIAAQTLLSSAMIM